MDDIEFLYEGNNPMLQTLLGAASNQWDISQSDLIENMLKIGFHESAGTFDPSIQQIGGGPGVGMYQYEKGLNQGAHTAVNRLISINNLDNNITLWNKEDGQPGWVNDLINNNYDVGQLTAEQQHLLFLADKAKETPTPSILNVPGCKIPPSFFPLAPAMLIAISDQKCVFPPSITNQSFSFIAS